MSFFIDKHNRRKSPIAIAAFGMAVLDMCVFGVLYALLAEPLYHAVAFDNPHLTNAVHSLIIAVLGTGICCLLFLLKDKRVVPYGFSGLAVALCMFYIAALLLDAESRSLMLYIISIYGLAPVLVGNTVTWPVYLKITRAHPTQNHRKTIQEELQEAIAKEGAKAASAAAAGEPGSRPRSSAASQSSASCADEAALFGPEAGRSPAVTHTAEEEAMLFYENDEESYD